MSRGKSVEKEEYFQQMVLEHYECLTGEKKKSEILPFIKINSKWMIVLNIMAKALTALDKNIRGNLCNFGANNGC